MTLKQIYAKKKYSVPFTRKEAKLSLRPLQFNYLSYELFWKKKSCQTPKKIKIKVDFGVLRTKVVSKYSVRLQKKKKKKSASLSLRIFIVHKDQVF